MQKTQTICLVILATIAVGFSLYYLKSVLLPFVIAMFVVIGCRPILEFVQQKLRLHRFFAFIVTFFAGVALLAGFALLTWLSINDLARNSESYELRLTNIVQWAAAHIPYSGDSNSAETQTDGSVIESQTSDAQSADENKSDELQQNMQDLLASATSYIQGQLLRLASSLSSLLSYGILILIFVFFLLLGQDGKEQTQPLIISEVEGKVRQYLLMKSVISAITGLAFGLVLWFFGVPLSFVFGFLAFLLNFIPNIGPLISTLTPVPFLVLNAQMSPTSAIICFILIASIQFVSGNVIETRIMGKSFDVSPVVLLLALMFFGLVWGIIGMFLATPIVSILKIVLYQNETTRPIAELMAGRWAVPDTDLV